MPEKIRRINLFFRSDCAGWMRRFRSVLSELRAVYEVIKNGIIAKFCKIESNNTRNCFSSKIISGRFDQKN